jgi:pantoate kinase
MDKTFWMVLVEGRQQPAVKHPTYDAAYEESKRLAKSTGLKAYVMKAITMADTSVITIDLKDNG